MSKASRSSSDRRLARSRARLEQLERSSGVLRSATVAERQRDRRRAPDRASGRPASISAAAASVAPGDGQRRRAPRADARSRSWKPMVRDRERQRVDEVVLVRRAVDAEQADRGGDGRLRRARRRPLQRRRASRAHACRRSSRAPAPHRPGAARRASRPRRSARARRPPCSRRAPRSRRCGRSPGRCITSPASVAAPRVVAVRRQRARQRRTHELGRPRVSSAVEQPRRSCRGPGCARSRRRRPCAADRSGRRAPCTITSRVRGSLNPESSTSARKRT